MILPLYSTVVYCMSAHQQRVVRSYSPAGSSTCIYAYTFFKNIRFIIMGLKLSTVDIFYSLPQTKIEEIVSFFIIHKIQPVLDYNSYRSLLSQALRGDKDEMISSVWNIFRDDDV